MKKRVYIGLALFFLLTTIISNKKIITSKLNLKIIEIENNLMLQSKDIKNSLASIYEKNLIFLNYNEIENILLQNSLIESFSIKKKFPDTLKIKIVEKKPIAILFYEKKRYYISDKIKTFEFKNHQEFQNLPQVFGEKEKFKIFYENLKKINFPFNQIKKYTLFKSNRWDIETKNNKIIKLPEKEYIKSLENYLMIINNKNFSKYLLFDYRIKNQLILK